MKRRRRMRLPPLQTGSSEVARRSVTWLHSRPMQIALDDDSWLEYWPGSTRPFPNVLLCDSSISLPFLICCVPQSVGYVCLLNSVGFVSRPGSNNQTTELNQTSSLPVQMTESRSICVNLSNNNGHCTYSTILHISVYKSLNISGLQFNPKMRLNHLHEWNRVSNLETSESFPGIIW